MARLIVAIIAFAMALAVIKMVIVALLIAGLIFRTKQTIGLLLIFGVFALLKASPAVGFGLLAIIIIAAIAKVVREEPTPGEPESPTLKLRRALDDPDQE